MGVVTFRCPTTGRDFSTGIHIDKDGFNKLTNTVTKAACPHCGRIHSWWTIEARLAASAMTVA
jgi:predicted RNA-binding Zn-ribbon protein involved in translation (DUF1610 family)